MFAWHSRIKTIYHASSTTPIFPFLSSYFIREAYCSTPKDKYLRCYFLCCIQHTYLASISSYKWVIVLLHNWEAREIFVRNSFLTYAEKRGATGDKYFVGKARRQNSSKYPHYYHGHP